jgi:hypothetical protein
MARRWWLVSPMLLAHRDAPFDALRAGIEEGFVAGERGESTRTTTFSKLARSPIRLRPRECNGRWLGGRSSRLIVK